MEITSVAKQLTQVLSVLRLQSNLQKLVLKDNAIVFTNKPKKKLQAHHYKLSTESAVKLKLIDLKLTDESS